MVLPPTCLVCGTEGRDEWDLCAGCHADLPLNRRVCPRCALPLNADMNVLCGQCQQHPPFFDQAFAPLVYRPPVDFLIARLKFHGQLAVARLLGEWLADALERRSTPLPEAIIPVPLHPRRLRQRGFNQALELARPVARRLGIALLPDCVHRHHATAPQMQLASAERHANVRGAFVVTQAIHAQRVAILDDVITTGSTVNEVARVLRSAGVKTIEVWGCARTPQND